MMQDPSDPAQTGQISAAQSAYLRIIDCIRQFESHLDADQEIAMGFAASEGGVLKIEGMGCYDPDLITFYGRDENGMKTQFIQHVAQISVILRAVPKASAQDAPPRRIGFLLQSGWHGGDAGDASV